MTYALKMLLALLIAAVVVLALVITTTVTAASTTADPDSGTDGPSMVAEDQATKLVQTRGCWIWCWRR